MSQTDRPGVAGFYRTKRKDVRLFLNSTRREDSIYADAVSQLDPATVKKLGLQHVSKQEIAKGSVSSPQLPVCERCHGLVHYRQGEPIPNPPIDAIADTIAESPHRNNHIYHVMDAADFPMSLIPHLRKRLSLSRLRTRNRRSRVKNHYIHGGLAELHFIITRSDLLAPTKEQVDRMMPKLVETLRSALGRDGRQIRLGNVRCVSAKRGWWIKEVKEEIWKRGGGGWMVGKANVGKSKLFEVVFPKGRGGTAIDLDKLRQDAAATAHPSMIATAEDSVAATVDHGSGLDELPFDIAPAEQSTLSDEASSKSLEEDSKDLSDSKSTIGGPSEAMTADHGLSLDELEPVETTVGTGTPPNAKPSKLPSDVAVAEPHTPSYEASTDFYNVDSLLPPPPQEIPFPQLPLVSAFSGTTASPIRLPYGDGRGELIDLPGLDRSALTEYILPERRFDAVMTSRTKASRKTLKPGQSLWLDGLIRITPTWPDAQVFMTHSFTNLRPHVSATAKALEVEAGAREHPIKDHMADLVKVRDAGGWQSAGKFSIKWDVTRAHAGPLVSKDAVGLKPDKLAWNTYAADILIEGCGWVEIVVEVRKNKKKSVQLPRPAQVASPSESVIQDAFTDELQAANELQRAIRGREAEEVHAFPEVEVFAPEGKFIGIREPLNAWLAGGLENKPRKESLKKRPRQSMRSVKARRQPQKPAGST